MPVIPLPLLFIEVAVSGRGPEALKPSYIIRSAVSSYSGDAYDPRGDLSMSCLGPDPLTSCARQASKTVVVERLYRSEQNRIRIAGPD